MNIPETYDKAPYVFSKKSLTTHVMEPKSHFEKAQPLLWEFPQ